eukprot:snap_masked-scaffold_4-processed-gene-7.57-mRNA-1 protein AED:0.20 eAED:0.20 QI:0/-1/0/1/-1/1/1/0/261
MSDDELANFEAEIAGLDTSNDAENESETKTAPKKQVNLKSLLSQTSSPAKPSPGIQITSTVSSKPAEFNPAFYTSKISSQHQNLESQKSQLAELSREKREQEAEFKENNDPPKPVTLQKKSKGKKNIRQVGNKTWEDKTLDEWPENDFRLFVGNLGPEATDRSLRDVFGVYNSYNTSKAVMSNKSSLQVKDRFGGKEEVCKGFGFVSFSDPKDMLHAIKNLNGKYCAGRPMQLKRSKWKERGIKQSKKRKKEEKKSKRIFS